MQAETSEETVTDIPGQSLKKPLPLAQLKAIAMGHKAARSAIYPGTMGVKRFRVPDSKVPWEVDNYFFETFGFIIFVEIIKIGWFTT